MIIKIESTVIFTYPQDYQKEQEWLKTKDEEWEKVEYGTTGSAYTKREVYSLG